MARTDWDAIVVGAGAGGASAAAHLVRAGLRVLVVDRARLPRYKACGGAIPRPTLERLGLPLEELVRAWPEAVRFTFPGQPPADLSLPDRPVGMVMRREFDAALLHRSGAEVLDGVAVTGVEETPGEVRVTAGDRSLRARTLVGADGAASSVARWLGLRQGRRLGGMLEAELPLEGSCRLAEEHGRRALFALGTIPWGYAWVFPKGDALSIGIGSFLPGRLDLRDLLRRAVEPLGISLSGIRLHGHLIPSYRPPPWPRWGTHSQERLATRRCLLVGDAAGLVDPLLGEGIRYALASGRLAAEAIARDGLAGYEAAVWREIGHGLATASQTASLFYGHPRRCYQLGVRNPATVRRFVDVLTEEAGYVGLGRRILRATLTSRWPIADSQRRTICHPRPAICHKPSANMEES